MTFHGHLCGRQIIGVRMAMAALRELGIRNPRSKEGLDLVVFVEIDRCATDAIIPVTGRTPGKRSIKNYSGLLTTCVPSWVLLEPHDDTVLSRMSSGRV
jgi:formylmethanofuran dehydrogenase subunit E